MVELLAPAGDKECFKAALMAGADAIYVGGKKYGARAYAGNFETEDLMECLRMAHLFDKKVYLTVNTLMKETELNGLASFLHPLYEEGLDGVIVQDLGALKHMREVFPDMELHASTQMTVTGAYGANLLKQYGVTRVVPARELSLKEITDIKEKTGLEIETFVHGAMCYGYSGQCLFSSMLGERSGNRGRCAGPCRLPYVVSYNGKRLNKENELYQLSLKDLCTLEVLPHLMDAGIDSFKIEGRMKTPEYVAFVTDMYRKYIDLYQNHPKNYCVAEEDMNLLKQRFSRGSIQPGYYFLHNGRELITLDKPGYQSFAAEVTMSADIQTAEKKEELKIDLIGHFYADADAQICFSVSCAKKPEMTVVSLGNMASKAQKCAATTEDVRKQLGKTGNTCFRFTEITFDMADDLFLPNKELNELRRDALAQMETLLLQNRRRTVKDTEAVNETEGASQTFAAKACSPVLQTEVRSMQQLEGLGDLEGISRVYIVTDIFSEVMQSRDMQIKLEQARERCAVSGVEFFLTFPRVCRQKTIKIMEEYRSLCKRLSPDGICVGSLESLGYVKATYPETKIVSDAGLYVFNTKTTEVFGDFSVQEHILPYELHRKEIEALINDKRIRGHAFVLPVYGYIPVMETAGCLLKTNGACRNGKGQEQVVLTDRHKKDRMVITHCDRCENTVYNAVPLSLHKEAGHIMDMPLRGIILKFSIENAIQTKAVLEEWRMRMRASSEAGGMMPETVIREFTKGHFAKGVE